MAHAGRKPAKNPEDPWTEEALAAALEEVQPLVEKVAERKFSKPLVVEKMGGQEQLERITEELRWIFRELMPDTPESLRDRMAVSGARGLSAGALGKYGVLDKRVYLNAEGLDLAVKAAKIPEEQRYDAIKLILAHEIGHALEDQVVDLVETVEELHDPEQLQAASATWEGLATWIEHEVAKELGTEDVFWKLTSLQGWDEDGLDKLEAFSIWSSYGQGHTFITAKHTAGGADAVWRTLEDPPAATSQIWRPETYDPAVPEPPLDYATILRGVEQKLTKGEWFVANTRVGETDLREAAIHDKDGVRDLERALKHLVWGHGLELERTDREAQIQIMEFDSPEAAHGWLALLKAQRTAVNAHRAGELGVSIEVITEPFEDAPGDDAVLRIERIPTGGGRHLERHQAWVVRGKTAVVVSAERFRPGLRLGWTVEEVFKRLDAASTPD